MTPPRRAEGGVPRTAVVTGAFGHIGRAATRALLARGWRVSTLTNRRRGPADPDVPSAALRFDPAHLRAALAGADVLVSTYWVRLPAHGASFEEAVANSRVLVDAAVAAGVSRVVYVSVANAALDAPTPYYRGKAAVEAHVRARAPSFGIVRPTLVVGDRDVLTGNIAWFLRRFPLILVPGGADHAVQPVTIDDTGRIVADAVEAAANVEVDAAGPERFPFRAYVETVGEAVGSRARVVTAPPRLFLGLLAAAGAVLRDVVVSADELEALRWGALVSRVPPLGTESVRRWLLAHGEGLGRRFANDRRARAPSSRAARATPARPAS